MRCSTVTDHMRMHMSQVCPTGSSINIIPEGPYRHIEQLSRSLHCPDQYLPGRISDGKVSDFPFPGDPDHIVIKINVSLCDRAQLRNTQGISIHDYDGILHHRCAQVT